MPKLIDLTNEKFGLLTVIKRYSENTKSGHPQWLCNCSCGTKNIIVSGSHLRNGHTKSCGCLQKIAARNNNYVDITGQRFGNLIAIKDIGSNKKGNAVWECKCNCGNIIQVRGIDLRNGHTKSCGCILSFGENKIIQILNENNISFKTQQTFDTCRFVETNAMAKFDFFIDGKYLIEYDGKQHFEQGGWNEDLKAIKSRDEYKNDWCRKNNIPLIRIPYTIYEQISLASIFSLYIAL